MSNYITTVYNETVRPETNYPVELTKYIFEKYKLKKRMKLLEPGFGRGEFLRGFEKLGLEVYGLDMSEEIFKISKIKNVSIANLEKDKISFPDNTFDVIFSKSFVEHLDNPENFMLESRRVLKKDGIIITLVPDWESQYKTFYDDHTHKTPYTLFGLKDLHIMYGFNNVDCIKFRQLPIVWKYPFINYFCNFLSIFTPVRTKNKFLRWSRELMLICVASN